MSNDRQPEYPCFVERSSQKAYIGVVNIFAVDYILLCDGDKMVNVY
jgi:hypothetical protein